MVVKERGLVELFNAFTMVVRERGYFSKRNEGKIYYYIIILKSCDFCCIINHLYECMIHVVKQIWY